MKGILPRWWVGRIYYVSAKTQGGAPPLAYRARSFPPRCEAVTPTLLMTCPAPENSTNSA